MQCLAAISNKLSYIQLPPIQASQFYPNEIKLKARIFHFAMLKLTQKPPLTYGMVQWLVVLGTTKRQQQERQKQTSNRFNPGLIICAKQDSTRRNKRRRFHLSFSKLRCCSQEYKSRKIHRHLVKRDRIIAMKIGKTPIFFLKKFHLLPGRSVRRVAADDYSLIWPLFQVGNFLVNCSKLYQNVYIYIYIYIYRLYKCQSHFFKYVFSLLV